MKKATLTALAAAIITASVSAQNLIVNPGFELSPPGQSASIPGWTATADVVAVANASNIGVSGHGGDQVLDLGGSFGTALGAKADVYQDGIHSRRRRRPVLQMGATPLRRHQPQSPFLDPG